MLLQVSYGSSAVFHHLVVFELSLRLTS